MGSILKVRWLFAMAFILISHGAYAQMHIGLEYPNGNVVGSDGSYYWPGPNGGLRGQNGVIYTDNDGDGTYVGTDGSYLRVSPATPPGSDGYGGGNSDGSSEDTYTIYHKVRCTCTSFREGCSLDIGSLISGHKRFGLVPNVRCSVEICETHFRSLIFQHCGGFYRFNY